MPDAALTINIKPEAGLKVKNLTLAQVCGRSKMSDFLNLPEHEFQKFICEIELDPLFRRLAYPDNKEEKVIKFKKFPGSDCYVKFYEFNEEISADFSSADIGEILNRNYEMIPVIRSLGPDKFKKYFLYNEGDMGINGISRVCGLDNKQTRAIMELVNDVLIREEFFSCNTIEPAVPDSCWRVAYIEKRAGQFIIRYSALNSARGRYQIDFRRLLALKERGVFRTGELKAVNNLISRIKLINTRKTLVYRILQVILEKQKKFLESGFEEDLVPFIQRDAARLLGITPGVICRTVSGKCVGLPFGGEMALKDFFVNNKKKKKELVKKIILENINSAKNKNMMSDKAVSKRLLERFGIKLARRTVCQYKNEIYDECREFRTMKGGV